ncbi:MAG: Na(+)/H(+) antiporter subunit D, partial [bacterium]
LYPQPLYQLLPYPVEYQPYTFSHLVTQFQLLLFAGFAFFVLLPLMKRTLTISLDFDWFYRRFLRIFATEFTIKTSDVRHQIEKNIRLRVEGFIKRLYRHHGPHGILARTWPSGGMVLWVALMLASILLASAIR